MPKETEHTQDIQAVTGQQIHTALIKALETHTNKGPDWRNRIAQAVQDQALQGVPAVLQNLFKEASTGSWKAAIAYLQMFVQPELEQMKQPGANLLAAAQNGTLTDSLQNLGESIMNKVQLSQPGTMGALEDFRKQMLTGRSPFLDTDFVEVEQPKKDEKTEMEAPISSQEDANPGACR
jgi:hypothetical protein